METRERDSRGTGFRTGAAAVVAALALAFATVPEAGAGDGAPPERAAKSKAAPLPPGKRLLYAYDGAGRLVRVADGTGRFVQYDYDPAGNLLRRRSTRLWHLSVKRPAKGAWVLSEAADGTVTGFGADDQRGLFDLTGTLDTSGPEATGILEIREPGSGTLQGSFTLAGSKVIAEKGTGQPLSLVLKGAGTGGSLSAKGVRPAGAFRAFRGTYASAKNQAVVGKVKGSPGRVDFVEEGSRPGVTLLQGGVTGTLVRDPKGKAWGEIDFDGTVHRVSSKLKDGAKSVKAKTGKGAAEKFQLKVAR